MSTSGASDVSPKLRKMLRKMKRVCYGNNEYYEYLFHLVCEYKSERINFYIFDK